ncbi:MAG TPA: hypothetical protein VF261_00950 [Candidatus Saccharimonadales bacterium]
MSAAEQSPTLQNILATTQPLPEGITPAEAIVAVGSPRDVSRDVARVQSMQKTRDDTLRKRESERDYQAVLRDGLAASVADIRAEQRPGWDQRAVAQQDLMRRYEELGSVVPASVLDRWFQSSENAEDPLRDSEIPSLLSARQGMVAKAEAAVNTAEAKISAHAGESALAGAVADTQRKLGRRNRLATYIAALGITAGALFFPSYALVQGAAAPDRGAAASVAEDHFAVVVLEDVGVGLSDIGLLAAAFVRTRSLAQAAGARQAHKRAGQKLAAAKLAQQRQ